MVERIVTRHISPYHAWQGPECVAPVSSAGEATQPPKPSGKVDGRITANKIIARSIKTNSIPAGSIVEVGDTSVAVCGICDIAGCYHLRGGSK